ncbi:zinc/manganese transport system substrate-binding protein/manganese/iron transport system substrate-binding protein [Nitrosomonas aestuarii]|uniref:Zinc/manganese transport system substrate-binding protein/manganese/iron transport system substrate-binding protein n=2 Tax=Nitrosomonas aestuarii TaxID=52441 RepID=A0A1I4ALH1_9PROT|nr:zinc/manganese transport system substrate-binding protein/manganese/iron transport system substrate-binding protein [Nitrosomonas aestuarii]
MLLSRQIKISGMKRPQLLVSTAFVFLVILLILNPANAEEPGKNMSVVTTVPPITNIVENVGGTYVNVVGIVPNGVDSHTFEPVPADAKTLAAADIIFVNGLDLEMPTIKLAEKVKKFDAPIVHLGNKTLRKEEWQYDFSFPREHGHPNPHLWPNIALTIKYVEIIRDYLVEFDPLHKDAYEANVSVYISKLKQLDEAIFACVKSIPESNRKLVTYHDSFAYFAPRYGMKVIAAIQPASFTEPGPREVIRIIEQIKNEKIPAIFGSEVFPSKIMAQIARESGARFIEELSDDELPAKPSDSFIGMMVNNMTIMSEALGGDPDCAANVDTRNLIH